MFRGILAALGLINFGFGILALAQPELMAGWIGFVLTGPSAYGEMRAVFGGAVTVVGVLFIVAASASKTGPLLGALTLVFAAVAFGRLVSLLVDGWSFYTVIALLYEVASATITGYLWGNPAALAGENAGRSADTYE